MGINDSGVGPVGKVREIIAEEYQLISLELEKCQRNGEGSSVYSDILEGKRGALRKIDMRIEVEVKGGQRGVEN